MKFLIFILAVLTQKINCQIPVCVSCKSPPYTNPDINCTCPNDSNKLLLKYACGPACDAIGNCCEFKELKCDPQVFCPQNKHVVPASPYPPKCQCACNNLGLLKCPYPSYYCKESCACECPWWGYKTCAKNQYFDPKTCSCLCKESCKDCSKPQKWNSKTCTCECPLKKSCKSHLFWNDWSCRCECKQAPRHCCPDLNKRWDPNTCDCVCDKIQKCPFNQYWNFITCRCEWIIKFQPMNVADRVAEISFCNPVPICNSEQIFNATTCECDWIDGWMVDPVNPDYKSMPNETYVLT